VGEQSLGRRVQERLQLNVLDSVIAGAFLVFALVVFFTIDGPFRRPDALGAILIVIATGALAFRRRFPLAVFLVTSAAALALHLFDYSDSGVPFAVVLMVYTVASRCSRRVSVVTTALLVIVVPLTFAAKQSANQDNGTVAGTLAVFVLAAVWGDRKKVRDAYVEQLQLREIEKERERVEAEQRAVTEERLRIARELHDVVAHALSVVAVQSGVAVHVIDARPAEAKRLLETISETSRDSLGEMRRLLAVLREDPERDGEDLAPAPGLADLRGLTERVRDAGVPVTLTVEGERPSMPPGVDVAAYRIAQEALTNVLKHAGHAAATVLVQYGADAVHLEVVDDGRGAAGVWSGTPVGNGSGQGLVGMRERATLYGGELEAGPQPGGGYRVATTLRFVPVSAG
jgi:signal transduction histidine kinase